MRTFLLIVGTVVLMVLGAGLYVWMQPEAPPPTRIAISHDPTTQPAIVPPVVETPETPSVPSAEPTTKPKEEPSSIVQSSENVWVRVYDEKTAKPLWQFRTAKHVPRPDGSIEVTSPEAEFFLEGQTIVIQGVRGQVIVPGEGARSAELRGSLPPPTRGELHDVTISIYPPDRQRALLVCKVNNIAFDNNTLRISTERFTQSDGTVIPADQVPVQIRGDDYDFDGRGLTILWNERDQRLQLLEIAHGESLTAKKGFQLDGKTPSTPARGGTSNAPAPRGTGARSSPATGRARGTGEQAVAASTRPATTQPVYRATFNTDVRVTEGDNPKPIAAADLMRVDYRTPQDSAAPAPTSAPAPVQRGGRRSGGAARGAAAQATPAPATAPTTSEAPQPMVIRWTGKLTIVPLETNVPNLPPEGMNVEMSSQSTPVVLNHSGYEINCASFSYSGVDNSVVVRNSPQVPLIMMTGADGGTISTPSLRFNGTDNKATLAGQSTATIPDPDNGGTLTVSWTQSCVLSLEGEFGQNLRPKQADMNGDVKISHPQFAMGSQSLRVAFAPPATNDKKASPQMQQLDAWGNVDCEIKDASATQHITSETLKVTFAAGTEGRMAPKTIVADGSVHYFGDGQDLKAGRLEAALLPTTRPSDRPAFERLIAERDVKFSRDKIKGESSALEIKGNEKDYDLHLRGSPASVSLDQTTLRGPIISINSTSQNLAVLGAGTLSGSQAFVKGALPSPFEMTWGRGLNLEGMKNNALVSGDVVIKTSTPDGISSRITGDTLVMEMADAPATQPATQSTTKPKDFDMFSNKVVQSLTIDGNAHVAVEESQQQVKKSDMNLYAAKVRIEPEGNRFVVPVPGQMLYQAAAKATPTTAPTTGPTTAPAIAKSGLLNDFSGPTAFQWSDELTYDINKQRAAIAGDVVIVHDLPGGDSYFRLEADKVVAQFQPPKEKTGEEPTTKPTEPDLQTLTADGNVRFTSQRIQFDAGHTDFDATSELLTADGADGAPVRVYDASGVSTGSVGRIHFNTRTQEMIIRDIQGKIRN